MVADSTNLYRYGLQAAAYLYNSSEKLHGSNQAVYTQKHRDPSIYKIGVLDIERSQLPDICPVPWQSETCIGGWFYDKKAHYKTPRHILDILIDSIAKNGTLLLNILQRPDGTIDEQADWILSELAKWFSVNAEAVHGTRPFRVSGEGHSCVVIDGFHEDEKVCSVELLGKGPATFAQHSGILVVDLPDGRDEEYPNVLKIRCS